MNRLANWLTVGLFIFGVTATFVTSATALIELIKGNAGTFLYLMCIAVYFLIASLALGRLVKEIETREIMDTVRAMTREDEEADCGD